MIKVNVDAKSDDQLTQQLTWCFETFGDDARTWDWGFAKFDRRSGTKEQYLEFNQWAVYFKFDDDAKASAFLLRWA